MSGENYYGLEILASSTGGVGANLGIRDIVLQSAEMLTNGVTSKEIASSDKQRLVLRFQTDVSFNEKYYAGGGQSWSNTDISANDWVIEISGNRPTGWNGWDAANNGQWVDISYALGHQIIPHKMQIADTK